MQENQKSIHHAKIQPYTVTKNTDERDSATNHCLRWPVHQVTLGGQPSYKHLGIIRVSIRSRGHHPESLDLNVMREKSGGLWTYTYLLSSLFSLILIEIQHAFQLWMWLTDRCGIISHNWDFDTNGEKLQNSRHVALVADNSKYYLHLSLF